MEQISLFNDEVDKNKSIILSASRMTDMPKYYPDTLVFEVMSRIEKGIDIHTVVLWTKHPNSLLTDKMITFIQNLYKLGIQVYLQCTITGMGGKVIGRDKNNMLLYMEKNAPDTDIALSALAEVKVLLQSPERIRLRIDPLIKIENINTGIIYTNLNCVKPIVDRASKMGITNFSISFLEGHNHRKVDKRFNDIGWSIISPKPDDKLNAKEWLNKIAKNYNVNVFSCCVTGLPESRCIDGYLLQSLHPLNKYIRKDEPRKRKLCACTHSIDIGGWPPKKCFTGCQYCYANSSY